MGNFRIQVLKTLEQARFWTNVYILDAPTLAEAHASALSVVVPFEQSIHKTTVFLHLVRTSTLQEGDDQFFTSTLDVRGSVIAQSDLLPLFNTVRVDVSTLGAGRPSRKYYRQPLEETQQAGGILAQQTVDYMNTHFNQLIADMDQAGTPLMDPDHQPLLAATTFQLVQMRQIHRKRRKKPQP